MAVPFFEVGEVLRRLAPRLGLETKLLERRVRQQWQGIVGEQVARHTQPGSIRFKKLTIHARSSVWVQQLALLKPTLLDKINEVAGGAEITDLVLRIGELDDRLPDQPSPSTAGREPTVDAPSEAELEAAAQHVLALRDEGLRTRLTRLIAAAPRSAGSGVRSAPRSPRKSPPRPDPS